MTPEHIDWTTVDDAASGPPTEPTGRRRRRRVSGRATVASSAIVLTLASAAIVDARTGDTVREGVRNGTATAETQVISGVTGERYGTRQSNISTGASAGGAAIYGCRRPTKECTRHVNLDNGPAAAFATKGSVPFTLSETAIGLVPRLNADRVDNLDAAQIVSLAQAGKSASAATADKATTADSATSATTAKSLDGYKPMGKMTFVPSSASNADEATALGAATEVPLGEAGPYTFYGKCFTDTDAGTGATPSVNVRVFVRTSSDGHLLDGGGGGLLDGDPAYLDTTTPEVNRTLDQTDTFDSTATLEFDEETGALVAPDGTVTEFKAIMAAKETTPPAGDGPYGSGQRCGFAVSISR